MEFLVKRDDLHETRFEDDAGPPELEAGQALLEVDSFGLTSNNITYAVIGDAMHYWEFFPTAEPGGGIPVWGFADVADSGDVTDLEKGARIYGYLPPSTHLVVEPEGADERGFVDASPHRAELPSAYQAYRRTDGAAAERLGDRDDELMLFCRSSTPRALIDDFLADSDFFGATTIVLSSASSKTAIIAAFMLAQREGISVVGLTSASNAAFVEGLGSTTLPSATRTSATCPLAAPSTSTCRAAPRSARPCTSATATTFGTTPSSARPTATSSAAPTGYPARARSSSSRRPGSRSAARTGAAPASTSA